MVELTENKTTQLSFVRAWAESGKTYIAHSSKSDIVKNQKEKTLESLM